MLRRTLVTASVLALLVLGATSAAEAQNDTGADVDARTLFDQGRAAYAEGRFEDAVRAFRRAYVLSPRYQLLYNIGQAELRAGHDDRALEAFEGFLRQAPEDAAQRSEVQERVTVLRGMGVTPSAAPPPDATEPAATEPAATEAPDAMTAPPSTESDSGGSDVAPWIVVGAGAAVLIAGGVLMGVGFAESDRVVSAPLGSRWVDLEGAADNANLYWGIGIGAAALGLAAVGAGIAWALAAPGSSESAASARLRIGPGSLAIEGEF